MPRHLPKLLPLLFVLSFALSLGGTSASPASAQSGGIRNVWPTDGSRNVDLGTGIGIEFARRMQHESVAQALTIRPFVPVGLSWSNAGQGERLAIQAQGTLLPSTTYRLELGSSIRDADGGAVIAEPFGWSFTTRGPRVEFHFSHDFPVQQVSPRSGHGVPLRLLERGLQLDAALYALDPPAFAERYASLKPGQLDEIDLAGLTRVAHWPHEVEAVGGRASEIVLPSETASGLYVLDVRHETTLDAQTLLVYGDPALAVKKGRTGLTAWLSKIGEQGWSATAEMTIYDAQGAPLESRSADADGVAIFEQAGDAAFVIARTQGPEGAHLSLAGLDDVWLAETRETISPPEITGHVHTDRPIYRPGQTVHYKATLRRLLGEDLRTIPEATAITVTLRDSRASVVAEQALAADDFGSIDGELLLGDEVSLGTWSIDAQVLGEHVWGAFQVEEYAKPDFEVEIETLEEGYARSDSVHLTVRATHYHGAPVSGAAVSLEVFRDRSAPGGEEPVFALDGTTDTAGEWAQTVTVDAVGDWLFEAEVVGASRRPVAARKTVPVFASSIALSLDAARSAIEVGRPLTLTVQADGRTGQPVAGALIDLAFWRRSGSGDERTRDEQLSTDAGGAAALSLADLPPGQYRIEATTHDTRGRRATAGFELWVFDPADADQWAGALEVTADQSSYSPGETALLMIKSPYRARALVTLEAAEVYDERVVEIGGLTTVDLPIHDAHAPNATARVLLWLPQDRLEDRAEGRLAFAETELSVPPEHRRLSVSVSAEQERYEPGEEATFTIRVTDAAGAPVDAQLSMALVDAAVLALYADPAGDIFDAFWQPRPRIVDTYDGLQPSHWDARYIPPGGLTPTPEPTGAPPSPAPPGPPPRTMTPTPAPSPSSTPSPSAPTGPPPPAATRAPDPGGPVPGPDLDADAAPLARLRREFPDTAYWNATLITGADGEVSVTLTLPDSLTTWQALVRAVTVDTLVGQGSGTVQVHKPISADPILPRFAVQGDSFALDVLARNDLGGTLDGSCTLAAPSLVMLDPGARALSLPEGRAVVARWSVVASEVGAGTLQADLTTADGADSIELPLEIHPFTVPELVTTSGSTQDAVTVPIEVPFNAMPHDTRVDVVLSSGVTHSVLEGIDQLVKFPYGCVEQTTSKMLPNAVVGRLLNKLDLQAPGIRSALVEYMPVGIQKLYGFQHADGSWGFWHGGRNVYLTTYVMHALTMIDDAGYDIDDNVINRGLDWLDGHLPAEPDATLRAYGAYVMAEAGRADLVQLERLWNGRENLDAFSLAALAIAMDAASANSRTEQALDELAEMSVREGDTVYWRADPSRRASWRSMASHPKSTAMALIALTRLRPESELTPMAARWLMEHRQGAGWGSTQSTIFSVVALADYMLTSGDPYATYDWGVRLDGEIVAQGRVDESSHTARLEPIVITGDQLSPGAHALTFEKQGYGTLYYSMAARLSLYHDGFEPTVPLGLGIDVTRRYDPVDGPAEDPAENDTWAIGDVINVRLNVNSSQELWYVLIEDLLPAGFEALNDVLDTEGGAGPMGPLPWRWDGYERKEIRDDRVTFFATQIGRGNHTFDYAVRAVTPGRFSARPAVAYAMYRSDVWGRSGSAQVEIAVDQVAARPPLLGDFDRDCKLTEFDAHLVADGWAVGGGGDGGGGDASDGSDAGAGVRDVTGDGRVTVSDVAVARAAGRAGLACGDAPPAPPGTSGTASVRLRTPADLAAHRAIELALVMDDALDVAGFETTLSWPEGAFSVVSVDVGAAVGSGWDAGDGGGASGDGVVPALLPDATRLGPVVDVDGRSSVRFGGFAETGASAAGESVVAIVRLLPLRAGEVRLELDGTQVIAADGSERDVTARGLSISPAPWQSVTTVFLPDLRAE